MIHGYMKIAGPVGLLGMAYAAYVVVSDTTRYNDALTEVKALVDNDCKPEQLSIDELEDIYIRAEKDIPILINRVGDVTLPRLTIEDLERVIESFSDSK